jgi:hypothetical protein
MNKPRVGKGVLQGTIAVASGWIAMSGGYLATMAIVGIVDSGNLGEDSQLSAGGGLIGFTVFYGCAVIGGFVTGVIARRDEIKHAMGLVLFTWLVNGGLLLLLAGGDLAAPLVNRYTIAAQLPLLPSVLAGGWLRTCQMTRSRVNSGFPGRN